MKNKTTSKTAAAPGIDLQGTSVGVAQAKPEPTPTVSMACESPCQSREYVAVKLDLPESSGQRIYRCIKCGKTKTANVGGPVFF